MASLYNCIVQKVGQWEFYTQGTRKWKSITTGRMKILFCEEANSIRRNDANHLALSNKNLQIIVTKRMSGNASYSRVTGKLNEETPVPNDRVAFWAAAKCKIPLWRNVHLFIDI